MQNKIECMLYTLIDSSDILSDLIRDYDGYAVVGIEITDFQHFQFPMEIYKLAIDYYEKQITFDNLRNSIKSMKIASFKSCKAYTQVAKEAAALYKKSFKIVRTIIVENPPTKREILLKEFNYLNDMNYKMLFLSDSLFGIIVGKSSYTNYMELDLARLYKFPMPIVKFNTEKNYQLSDYAHDIQYDKRPPLYIKANKVASGVTHSEEHKQMPANPKSGAIAKNTFPQPVVLDEDDVNKMKVSVVPPNPPPFSKEYICVICHMKHTDQKTNIHLKGPTINEHYASGECIVKYVKGRLKELISIDSSYREIQCPQCKIYIHPDFIKQLVDVDIDIPYETLLEQSKMLYPLPINEPSGAACAFEPTTKFKREELIQICEYRHYAQPWKIIQVIQSANQDGKTKLDCPIFGEKIKVHPISINSSDTKKYPQLAAIANNFIKK
jgi:DNA-directed RNA polymerase subunit RPC12/RpoP